MPLNIAGSELIRLAELADPPYGMTPISLTDEVQPPIQCPTNPANEEVLMGLFIGQLPRSVTAQRVRNLIITLSNILKFPLRLYHVDIHQRSGSCAFATVNQSAAYTIVSLDKSFAIDADSLWLARNNDQKQMLASFLSQQTAVPRKPIVLELRATVSGPTASHFPIQGAPQQQFQMQVPFVAPIPQIPHLLPSLQPQAAWIVNMPPPASFAPSTRQEGSCVECQYQHSSVPSDCILSCCVCCAPVTIVAWICPSCLMTRCQSCHSRNSENPFFIPGH
jgi:hypothetical protein